MSKPIKSGVRKLLFTMLSKHNAVKTEERKFILEKEKLLSEIVDVSESNESDLASTRIKELVAKIKEIDSQKSIANETNFLKKISFLTGISESSLWRIKKEGAINEGQWDTPGKKRPRQATKSNLDDFDITAIRNKINEFYNVKKQVPTLRRLHGELKEAISFSGCLETLRQVLHKNGYEFKKNLNERALLIERHDIAAWRHRYLRTIAQKRSEGKTIVYIDETYVHQNYKVKKSWQGPSTSGVINKISSGKRHIVVFSGSEKGSIPNSLLVFSTKSKLADYHDDMNARNFLNWLRNKLLPNLPESSVIVMDNASYHITQINKPPSSNSLKADIQKWLTEKGVAFEPFYSKDELMCLVNGSKVPPVYEAEEILKEHGHEVLKLPPYHCDLNAIELIWSLAKRKIASRNVKQCAPEMEALINESFLSITPAEWKSCTNHVINVENEYKSRDRISENLEPFIINLNDDDDEQSFEDIQYLESDSDF